ncbi:carboxymuconolactone decarboxylase family protein [Lederbergia graminis]|uniref:Carboxymuconolactone decarboxylase family protein n=1 Tax=Lederbergia graminis TaxID=735518 RepID=A0ABW0LED4_9BACI
MNNRMNYFKVAPSALEKVMELEKYTNSTAIDKKLMELIKIRVSQINGCSYCLNMHTKTARKLKVPEEQIEQLDKWKEADIFTPSERVAIELSESVTLIADNGVNDDLYERVRKHYDEKEYVDLIMIINQINIWNRISISMGNQGT